MSTHFTIPLRRSPCGGGSYQAMPADLSAHLSLDEYAASLNRIQAANRSPLGARLLYALSWLGYMAGLLQVVGLFNGYESASAYGYDDYYVNSTWIGLGVAVSSFVALVALGRYMRKRRAAQVAAAVQAEHVTYSMRSPQLAWRVVDANHIEINVLDVHNQQHIASLEHQVHVLQQQVAQQQHHQAVDHELIQHQANAARHAAHYAPSPVAVAPVVQSPSHFHVQYYPTVAAAAPVAEPVYAQAVYQPAAGSVFAHPPPQYYAPRSDIRAPLVQHQHY